MASIFCRVVVVGYGFLGKFHVEKSLANERAHLIAVVETQRAARENARKAIEDQDVQIVDTIAEIAVDTFDALIIVTPTTTHAQWVRWALANGKHVFCEKPLTISSQTAKELVCETPANLVTQVGHSERCHLLFDQQEKRNIWSVAANILNDSSASVKFTRLAVFKGRGLDVSVGADLMIHDLDLAQMLFGLDNYELLDVHGVQLLTRTTVNDNVRDRLYARYKCKTTQNIPKYLEFEVGRGYHREIRQLIVWSRYGVLTIDLLDREVFIVRDGCVDAYTYAKRDHLAIEQAEFYDCILHNRVPKVTFSTALVSIKHLEHIERQVHHESSQPL